VSDRASKTIAQKRLIASSDEGQRRIARNAKHTADEEAKASQKMNQEVLTVVSCFFDEGKNQLGTFQLRFRDGKPEAALEFLDVKGQKIAKVASLNPNQLQKLPPDSKWKADYFYQGNIVFPKVGDN
jgi:hypothetical protein